MSGVTGREVVAVYGAGVTWDTEVGTGLKQIKFTDENLSEENSMEEVEEINSPWGSEDELGPQSAKADLSQRMRFDDIALLMAVLGSDNYEAVTEVNVGSQDYQHINRPSLRNSGLFFTYAAKKGNRIQVIPSLKINGFSLKGQASPNRFTVSYMSAGSRLIEDSAIVDGAAIAGAAAAVSGPGGYGYFRGLKVYMNDRSGAALAAGDEILSKITAAELTVQRNQVADQTNTSGLGTEEPEDDGIFSVRIKLTFKDFDDFLGGLKTDLANQTRKKVKLEIIGGPASSEVGTVAPASWTFEFCNAQIVSVPAGSVSGANRIPGGEVELKCIGNLDGATVNGMSFNESFKFTGVNNQAVKVI